jgi:two-component system heavy metal sensor histidine kinase CusS
MKSFTARLTTRIALLVTVLATTLLLFGGVLLDHQIERGLDLLHEVEAKELAELLGDQPALTVEEIGQRIQHDADSDAALFFMQIARDGNVLFRSSNLSATILPLESLDGPVWTTRLPFLGRLRLLATSAGPWRIVIGSSLANSERLMQDYVEIALGLIVGVALASIGLGYVVSRAALAPIRQIDATARRIGADNLGERIPVSGRDELADLTRLLNETFDRLQGSFEQVRRFSADVSHELKTPLALLRLNAEKLHARLPVGDSEGRAALEDMLEEIGRMNSVIERLLFIAKSESGAVAVARRAVALAPWLANFADDAMALAEDRGVRFRLGAAPAGEAQLDADLWRQLLLNLVTNAVAVSPRDGVVTLDVEPQAGGWVFAVTDEGPGLPEEQLTRVFERFVRVAPPGGAWEETRGHGLGLAICQAIVDLHGGTIWAENRVGARGLRVVVRLPAPAL